MENGTRNLARAAMTAAVVLMAAAPANAEPTRLIVLRVCYGDDPTSMQVQLFERAQKQATEIYAAIGISLVWIDTVTTAVGAEGMHLTVHVLSDTRTDRFMKHNQHLPDSVLGVAPNQTNRVYVFWDRIVRRARTGGVFVDRVLGRALAHEIGHHLLPAKGHSDTGLMRASLDYELPAAPNFTNAQVESIRTFLAAN